MANGYLSNAFADAVLAAVFTGDYSGLPANYWVDLTLALPTDGVGTGLVAAGCGRVQIPADGASWTSMGEGSRSFESAIDVVYPTADEDLGQVLGYTLYDAETDGIYLGFGITNPLIITAGMTPRVPAGLIVITLPTT